MPLSRFVSSCAPAACPPLFALLFLSSAFACSSPNGDKLFAKGDAASVASGANGGSASAASGTGSSAGTEQGPEQGGSAAAGGTDTGGAPPSIAGSANVEQGGTQSSGGSDGKGGSQATQPVVIESCDMLEGAVTNEANGHCYRVNADLLTFAAAQDACVASGGHLVTVTSEDENKFVHELLGESHWLGADDGRDDRSPGVGDYTWVNGEEWDFTDWDGGQPNAVATNCANENSGSHCYEHCAYQSAAGGWIDRACFHTIQSVCEWEPVSQ